MADRAARWPTSRLTLAGSTVISPATTWIVQTAGVIPTSRALRVVVPTFFGVSVPVAWSKEATDVSLNSQVM